MEENKRVKSWLKRKVRITEALIVAFFISGNLGYAQESSSQNNDTKEDGIAIGRIIKVKLGQGVVMEVKSQEDSKGEYSFAEKGTAKAELAQNFDAGFRLTNYTNPWNKNYETMIGATQHINGEEKDRYANMKEKSCKENCEENKLAKSIAIGSDSVARNASIAIGDYAFASRKRNNHEQEDENKVQGAAIAIGSFATATGSSSISLGAAAAAQGSNSIAIGRQSAAVDETSIAIGKIASAVGKGSLAFGESAWAIMDNSISVGKSSIALQEGGISFGVQSESLGNEAVAIGKSSNAIGDKSLALGSGAKVTYVNNVALGANSEDEEYGKVENVKIEPILKDEKEIQVSNNNIEISTDKFAGMKKNESGNSYGVVSIGKKGAERQLQNVAAGRITQDSTDAINGSQLFAVASYLSSGWKIANESGVVGNVTLNKRVSFVGENGAMVKVENDNGNGYKVKISAPQTEVTSKDGSVQVLGMSDAIDRHNSYDLSVRKATLSLSEDKQSVQYDSDDFITGANASKVITEAMQSARTEIEDGKNTKVIPYTGLKGQNLYKINVEGDLQDINSLQNGSTKITLKKDEKEVDMGDSKITNVAKGTKAKDVVNVSQLRESEKKGLNFMGNDGNNIHRNLGQTLRIKGEGLTQEESKKFRSAKGNINVKHTGKSILEVQLAKDLKHIESISNGGDIKGTKITLENGRKEVNVNGAKITNLQKGILDTDAVNVKQLKEYSINLERKGLSFVGNDGEIVHQNLGSTLNIKGEGVSKEESKKFQSAKGNINVKKGTNPEELLLQLAEKLNNIKSLSNNGNTINLENKYIMFNQDLHMGKAGEEHQIKHLKDGTSDTDAVNKRQLEKATAAATTKVLGDEKNVHVESTTNKDSSMTYTVSLKDKIELGKNSETKIIVDGEQGKVQIGKEINMDGKTGSATFGKIQMNQEKNEKGETKATITGLENTDITAPDFAKKGRAATEEQLQKVHQDTTKKIENLSQEITQKGLNFGADQGKDVHRNLGDTQKIVGDKKNITTSIMETGDLKVELNKKIEVEKLSIPKKEGGEAASISSENGVGTLYLAGKPGKDGKSTGAKISVEEGSAGVEAKDPKKETMERIVYQDSKGNSHTVATHDDGLKFQGDDGKTVNKKLNETLRITGGEQDPNKLSQGNIGVISTENGGLTIQLAKELKDLSKITLIDGNGNKAVIDGKGLVFEGQDGKKTQLTSNGLDNGGNRITNVAAGKEPTDAVNVSQLNEVKGAVQQNAHRIDKMNGEMKRGFANSAAMSTLKFMEIGLNQAAVGAAIGTYKGTQAVAVGVQGAPTENVRVHANISMAPDRDKVDTMAGIGATWRFNLK